MPRSATDRPSPSDRRPPDRHDADELFTAHESIATAAARRYSRGPGLDEDLVQVARVGVLIASRRFDPDKGDFPPYAMATAAGEVKKHLRNHGWAVHVPRRLQEDTITFARARDRLTAELGRNPGLHEIAAITGFSVPRAERAAAARDARFGFDLDVAPNRAPVHHDARADDHDDELAIVRAAVAGLGRRERELVALRFEDDLSQAEIGLRIGISQAQVHRRLSSLLSVLERRLSVAA